MTKLNAVNRMLDLLGAPPEDSLVSSDLSLEGSRALTRLDDEVSYFQSQGWYFNTFTRTLKQDIDGYIYLPNNTLRVDTIDPTDKNIHKKGNRLYDFENNTYAINRDIEVEIILELDFEDMPYEAQEYIVAKASKEFQMDLQGSEMLYRALQAQEAEAYVRFKKQDSDVGDYNMLENSELQDLLWRGY